MRNCFVRNGCAFGLLQGQRNFKTGAVMSEILTIAQMYEADKRTIENGLAGEALMENAGQAVVDAILQRFSPCSVSVLCGPGNNGGDGFVIARLLRAQGWNVRLGLFGQLADLTGDAALNAEKWQGVAELLSPALLVGADLIVDCIFGAGLSRDITGDMAELVHAVNDSNVRVVAVDMPSGIDGVSGAVRGVAIEADLTVTFCRPKPGHYLLPGREMCGERVVADIGISDKTVASLHPDIFINDPRFWARHIPWPGIAGHKYNRGHVLALGGAQTTGATRLAARAARRAGAGLLTVLAEPAVLPLYAQDAPGVMVAPIARFEDLMQDCRHNGVLIGPGAGVGDDTRKRVVHALHCARACVLDADALTSFADEPSTLFFAVQGPTVMTPHEGEFGRLFADMTGDKVTRARAAAKRSGAVIVLKGADTVVAAPDGRVTINDVFAPWLATAGSGDVLAGIVIGLLAQGMPAFEATSMAVWLHGQAGHNFGPGLIAEDIPDALPVLLAKLWQGRMDA
jgi:NAD(P)H-hydrate epimerase